MGADPEDAVGAAAEDAVSAPAEDEACGAAKDDATEAERLVPARCAEGAEPLADDNQAIPSAPTASAVPTAMPTRSLLARETLWAR